MIKIDSINKEQASQLAELQVLTFKQAYSNVHSAENIAAYCNSHYTSEIAATDLSSVDTVCCIGHVDSQACGYYLVKHQACPIALDSSSSELKQIYVLSSAYSTGLGRALYDHALTTIRSKGHDWVWLCVSDLNYRAQAFYKKLGFDKVGAGPAIEVGKDTLQSSLLALKL